MNKIKEAKKSNILPEIGTKVRIKKRIMSKKRCGGFFVHQRHIDCRKEGVNGEYIGYVPDAGGDVWWIKHEDGTIGAYMFTEVLDV